MIRITYIPIWKWFNSWLIQLSYCLIRFDSWLIQFSYCLFRFDSWLKKKWLILESIHNSTLSRIQPCLPENTFCCTVLSSLPVQLVCTVTSRVCTGDRAPFVSTAARRWQRRWTLAAGARGRDDLLHRRPLQERCLCRVWTLFGWHRYPCRLHRGSPVSAKKFLVSRSYRELPQTFFAVGWLSN